MIEESCLDPRTEPRQPKPSENYGWACLAKESTEIISQGKALEIHVSVYRLSATEPVVSQLELLLWESYSTNCLWSSIYTKKQLEIHWNYISSCCRCLMMACWNDMCGGLRNRICNCTGRNILTEWALTKIRFFCQQFLASLL